MSALVSLLVECLGNIQPSMKLARMVKSNPHLSPERAELAIHGSNRNEDGSYSWKFDNYTPAVPQRYELRRPDATVGKNRLPHLLLNAKQGFEHRTGQMDPSNTSNRA